MTDEEILKIYYEEYINGDSTIVIGKRYGIHYSTLRNKFIKLGLKLRSNKENSRKYFCNDNIFSNINTPEQAYWIGFLSADGYVSNAKGNNKKIGLALSVKDKTHLEKFKNFISATYPIHEYVSSGFSSNEYCRIVVSSDKMFDDLCRIGIIENKTSILDAPKNTPEKLLRYYILGYFDGDGPIYLSHAKYPFYCINIVGTNKICNFINKILLDNNIINKSAKLEKRKEDQIVSYIRFGGNNIVSKILGFLYDGIYEEVPLRRKYELYKKCVNRIFN